MLLLRPNQSTVKVLKAQSTEGICNQAQSEYKYLLTFRARRYVVIATKPVHRLQICPIVHNYRAPPTIPPCYIRVRAVVWECGEGHTHRQTHRRA